VLIPFSGDEKYNARRDAYNFHLLILTHRVDILVHDKNDSANIRLKMLEKHFCALQEYTPMRIAILQKQMKCKTMAYIGSI